MTPTLSLVALTKHYVEYSRAPPKKTRAFLQYRGLNSFKYHFEVHLRDLILQLYQE